MNGCASVAGECCEVIKKHRAINTTSVEGESWHRHMRHNSCSHAVTRESMSACDFTLVTPPSLSQPTRGSHGKSGYSSALQLCLAYLVAVRHLTKDVCVKGFSIHHQPRRCFSVFVSRDQPHHSAQVSDRATAIKYDSSHQASLQALVHVQRIFKVKARKIAVLVQATIQACV